MNITSASDDSGYRKELVRRSTISTVAVLTLLFTLGHYASVEAQERSSCGDCF